MKKVNLFNGRVLGLAAISAFAAVSQAQTTDVRINGQTVHFMGVQPYMMDGQLIVPLRTIAEQTGANIEWSPVDKVVTVQKGTTNLEIHVPSEVAKVNGTETSVPGPIHLQNGWTMVPIQFIADTLGARIEYGDSSTQANYITTDTEPTMYPSSTEVTPTPETQTPPSPDMWYQPVGSVLKAKLDSELSSSNSYVGQPFTATVDADGSNSSGIPDGTMIRGHVSFVQPMSDGVPGILGLEFDEVVLSDGRTLSLTASPIDVDRDIELNESGRWMATSDGLAKDNLKFVGVDSANSGVLVSLTTNDTPVSIDQINTILPGHGEPYDVVLNEGTLLGVRIDRESNFND